MVVLKISKSGKQVGRKEANDEITSIKLLKIILINLFLVILSLHCCLGFFFSGSMRGYSSVVMHSLLAAVTSLVERRLWGT